MNRHPWFAGGHLRLSEQVFRVSRGANAQPAYMRSTE
jgi:hypothetical protein